MPQWWREHFLGAELGLAVVLTAAFVGWAELLDGVLVVDRLLRQNRGAIYGTLASIFGSLLGFVITTVSIVIGFSASERLAVVRESRHYPVLWNVFISAIRVLGVATVAALGGLLFDRDGNPNRVVLYTCMFTVVLAGLRLARCVWVLENVIEIVTKKVDARSRGA